VFYFNTAEMK